MRSCYNWTNQLKLVGFVLWYFWFISGTFLVQFWYILIQFWYVTYGTFMVHLWYIYGTFMVHLWYIYGTFMIHLWYIYGTFMVYFLIHIRLHFQSIFSRSLYFWYISNVRYIVQTAVFELFYINLKILIESITQFKVDLCVLFSQCVSFINSLACKLVPQEDVNICEFLLLSTHFWPIVTGSLT